MNRLISVLTALGGLVVFPLVDSAIKGTIVLLLAGTVCLMLRRDSAATRHFVLSTALGLLLVMPLLSLVLPAWRILPAWLRSNEPAVVAAPSTFIAPTEVLSPVKMARPDSDLLPWPTDERPASEMVPLPGRPAIQDIEQDTKIRSADTEYQPVETGLSTISWTTWLSGVWFASCVLLATRLVVASLMLRRSARRSVLVETFPGERQGVSPPCLSHRPDRRILAGAVVDQQPRLAPGGSQGSETQAIGKSEDRRADAQPLAEVQRLQAALVHAKTMLGVTRSVQMMLDPHRSIPVVWGLWKTRLQLPAEAISWSDEQLRSVLLHELAHVRRRDLFVLALTQLVCALYWFNPLVWLAAWRLHVERERACDDLVLASGVRASAYAEHLLNVATQLNSSRWTHACGLAMSRNSSLHGRLTAVLSEKQNRRRMTNLITCVALTIAGAISVPIAMLQAASLQSDEKAVTDPKQQEDPNTTAPPAIATAPIPAALNAALRAAIVATENGKEQPRRPVGPPAAMKDDNAAVEKPKHEATASLIAKWQRRARSDGRIPGSLLGTVRTQIDALVEEYPHDDATPGLQALLPSYDVTHDWDLADVIVLLDKTAVLHTAPLGWADLTLEFSDMRRVRSGTPLPESLRNAAWGEPAENGLRAASVLDPLAESYSLGTVLKSRVLFHNTGKSPIMFLTETWRQDDQHQARDAGGQEIKVGSTWYSGGSPMSIFRLKPGDSIEINGPRIGIGAGEYQQELITSSVDAWIQANVGDEVHFTTTMRLDQQGWTRHDYPTEPEELRKMFIAERVALESPLPGSAADRKQLITRVTNEIFGDDPIDTEVNDFLNDTSPDALLNLTVRLQRREHIPLFRGTLATGETIFKVLPVDPDAANRPRRAIGPGRYVLGDSVQLAVQQLAIIDRFGALEVCTNNAKILFLSPDPKVESPHATYEIGLPDGLANYAILWTRNSGQLFVVEPGSVRTIDFTNPAGVTESRSKLNLAPEYRSLIPESLQGALE